MVRPPDYPHLPLIFSRPGPARLTGGGQSHPTTAANRGANRASHSAQLSGQAALFSAAWQQQQQQRLAEGLPIAPGIPLLLQVDPGLDLTELQEKLGFEVVLEHDDGFIIVASEQLDLELLRRRIDEFARKITGAGLIASIHKLVETTDDRLKRILDEHLYAQWPSLDDDATFTVDVGIACEGDLVIPERPTEPTRGAAESDRAWGARLARYHESLSDWSRQRHRVYTAWDDLKDRRERELLQLVQQTYGGKVEDLGDGLVGTELPDSFTVRVVLPGRALRDLVLNHPYVFEVTEPDDVRHTTTGQDGHVALPDTFELTPPEPAAPAVGVIDSGIQEAHRLLAPAVDTESSFCLLPREPDTVADLVRGGGHGTRVAGAVLHGESMPVTGRHVLAHWLQNARVLDKDCIMPLELFPPLVLRSAVLKLRGGPKRTRLFNHAITARAPCRTRHMSAWAAEIDALSYEHDVLVVQSAGNVDRQDIVSHLRADRPYPRFLRAPSSRVANPAQSLQALTVGSVGYEVFEGPMGRSFASTPHGPSPFSRTGPGIWGVIKPELVELGGDFVLTTGTPLGVATPPAAAALYPELVRSTLHGGPLSDRDAVGTSYAAPKVTHLAARLEALLPMASTLLYRALLVQSARWPTWAEALIDEALAAKEEVEKALRRQSGARSRAKKKGAEPPTSEPVDTTRRKAARERLSDAIRHLGYGLPSAERALESAPYRSTHYADAPDRPIQVGTCHLHRVPLPPQVRNASPGAEVLIEVTLSYAAVPRRTRRTPKRYLATWLDWKTNRLGESLADFAGRALKDEDQAEGSGKGIPWVLGTAQRHGLIRGFSRSTGTVQKDWARVRLDKLPDEFCVAVVAHKGFSSDPEASARYALVVTFEVLDRSVPLYEEVRAALAEVEVEVDEVEVFGA